jgi:C4-dicarboxylate transporter DctQ subunit
MDNRMKGNNLMRLYRNIARFENIFCVFSLGVMTFAICLEVFFRYVLALPFQGPEEITIYFQIAVTFIGAAVLVRREKHICVDLLHNILPNEFMIQITNVLKNLIGIAFCAIFSYLALDYFIYGIESKQVSPALGIPVYIPYATLVLGAVLMSLHFVINFVNTLKFFISDKGKRP